MFKGGVRPGIRIKKNSLTKRSSIIQEYNLLLNKLRNYIENMNALVNKGGNIRWWNLKQKLFKLNDKPQEIMTKEELDIHYLERTGMKYDEFIKSCKPLTEQQKKNMA